MDHDMKTSRIFKTVTAFMAAAVLFVSCKKDEAPAVPAQNAADLQEISVSTDILILEGVPEAESSGETKSSVLTASGIESKVTGITLAAYCEGTLAAKKHYTSSLSSMVLTLMKDKTYTVYALANMGDMVSSIPASESSMSTLEYSISSYSTVNSNGIPMAGKKEGVSVSSTSTSFSIPLTRLLAKVTANINCTWENPRIQEVRVFNMNKRLRPFGTSVAGSASDILSFQDYETASNGATCTVTLYVPENMQGTISGITDSFHKTNDQGNATVSGKQSLLTYLQTKVSSSSMYSGDVYYRSYLGNNNTTNFDIRRNTHYVWNLTYTEEGLQHNDWKHDTDELTGVRYRYDVSPASQDLQVGQQDDWQVRKYTDTYADGSWTNGTTPNVVARSLYSYTVANPAVATVAAADANTYRTTGVSQGSTNINITVDGNSLVLPVNVTNMISYALEVESSPASASANVGQTIELRAIYYVLTNGVRDSGTDVTTDAQWSRVSGSSAISVVNAGTEKGCVTATAGGTATIRASYNSMTADKAVTFGDVYAFSVSPTNVSFRIGNTQTITPTRTVNGAASTAGTIEWTTSDANVATVSSAGVITGKGVGTATVTAVWKVNGNEVGRATISVSVAANVYVLAIDPTSAAINVGGTRQHSVTTRTKDGAASTEGSIVWSSANSGIASVSTSGLVTGVAAGTTTVTAEWKINNVTVASATSSITVSNVVSNRLAVTSVPSPATANVGETITLSARYYTTTNGVEDGGVDVTQSASWSRVSGASTVSVTNSGTKGRATATAGGTATMRASYNGKTADIDVTFNDVYSFSVSPTSVNFRIGNTQGITASRVKNGAASTEGSVSWSSANSGIASVSTSGVITGVAVGSTTVTAIWTIGSTEVGRATVSVSVAANQYVLAVSPTTSSINVGGHSDHSVTTRTKDGAASNEGSIVWSSDNTAIATVNSDGRITGVAAGTTTVRAAWKIGSATVATATVSVTVSNVVTHRIGVTASPSATANVGQTITLTAKYYTTTNGVEDAGVDITQLGDWSRSSGASTISVTNSGTKGRVTATAGGTAVIGVSYSGINGSVSVKFNDVYGLTVTPATASVYVNATVNLQANRTFNGAASTAGTLSWSSNKTNIATVNASTGVVTGVAPGTARITATWTYNGHTETAYANVTVNANNYSLTISPSSATKNVGETQQFSVTAYKNGSVFASPSITWSSSASGVASVNATGLATGVSSGTATITATWNPEGTPITASAPMTVNDVITHTLVLSSTTTSTDCGNSIPLTLLYKTITNGTETASQNVTTNGSVTWNKSSNLLIVSGGQASATSGVTATLSATYSGVTSNTITLTFNDVYELTVSPSNASAECGNTIQLSVVATKNDLPIANPTISWSSSNTNIARVNSNGLVSSWNPGTAQITARLMVGGQQKASDIAVVTFTGGSYTDYYAQLLYWGSNPYSDPNTLEMMASGGTRPSYAAFKLHRRNWTYANGAWSNTDTTLNYNEYSATFTGNLSSVTAVSSQNYWQAVTRPTWIGTGTITCTVASDGAVVNIPFRVYPATGVISHDYSVTLTANGSSSSASAQVGNSIKLTVTLQDIVRQDGLVIGSSTSDVTGQVTWYKPSSITIDAAGYATSDSPISNADVYAYYNAQARTSNHVNLTFTAAPVVHTYGLQVVPLTSSHPSVQVGGTQQFQAYLVTDGVAASSPLTSGVTWSSGNTSKVTINSSGVATGVAATTSAVNIHAVYSHTSGQLTGDSELSVTEAPVVHTYELVVEPNSASVSVGGTKQFRAYIITDGNTAGKTLIEAGLTWSSYNTSKVTINSSTGLATGVAATTSPVTVHVVYNHTSGQLSGDAYLSVTADSYSLQINPMALNLYIGGTIGNTGSISVTTRTKNGSASTTGTIRWVSDNTTVATVTTPGTSTTVTGVGKGTTIVTAEWVIGDAVVASATCNVTVTKLALVVEPVNASISVGNTHQYRVYLVTNDNTAGKQQLTSGVSWTSSNMTAATINASGQVTGRAVGSTDITASYNHTNAGTLTVTTGLTVISGGSGGGGGINIDDGWD